MQQLKDLIGRLTPRQTEEAATLLLCELDDTRCIDAILQAVGADDALRDELISQLEEL